MAEVAIKLKVMPESLDTNLEEIQNKGKEKIEAEGGKINNFETQEVAFGLKALMVTISLDEDKGTDVAENVFSEIEGVSSVEIADYRRAFG